MTNRHGGPLGVALVGAGAAGRQHLAAAAGSAEVEVVAVCDSDPQLAHALAAQSSGDRLTVHADLADVLADSRVDLVAIATPPGTHRALAHQVLAGGRAVLVEKPPLLAEDDLRAVVADADRRGLVAGVMLQHRFRLPRPAVLQPWAASAVAVVEVVRHRAAHHYHEAAWRVDPRESGGGLLAHLGVHYLDLACQLLGEPDDVVAHIDPLPGADIDQRAVLSVHFRSGARLAFIGTTALHSHGERLAVYDAERQLLVDGARTCYISDVKTELPVPPTSELRTRVYDDVAAAVRNGRAPAIADLRTSLGVVRLLEAARRQLVAEAAA
jgi:predicted dehydrogenase